MELLGGFGLGQRSLSIHLKIGTTSLDRRSWLQSGVKARPGQRTGGEDRAQRIAGPKALVDGIRG